MVSPMQPQIWAASTQDPADFHAFPAEQREAMCDSSVRMSGHYLGPDAWPKLYGSEIPLLPYQATRCPDCYTRATEGSDTKGQLMDVTTTAGKEAVERIRAAIERVITLHKDGNTSGADELQEETDSAISDLKGKGSIALKKELREALVRAAATQPLPAEVPAGYERFEGVSTLVQRAQTQVNEGIDTGVKMAKIARDIALTLLEIRLSIPYNGLPDLNLTSGEGKAAAQDMYANAGAHIPDEAVRAATVLSLRRAVHYQSSRVIEDWLTALDTSEESEVRRFFPELPEDVHGDFQRAVFDLYESKGIKLPGAKRLESKPTGPLAELETARKTLDAVVKSSAKLRPAERAKIKDELTTMATRLIAEVARLDEETRADKARAKATEQVRTALDGIPLTIDSLEEFKAAAVAALEGREDVPSSAVRQADWEALYGAYKDAAAAAA